MELAVLFTDGHHVLLSAHEAQKQGKQVFPLPAGISAWKDGVTHII